MPGGSLLGMAYEKTVEVCDFKGRKFIAGGLPDW
jgi:hypothetical protein